MSKKEAFPRRKIISNKRTVTISSNISVYNQNPIPTPVNRHPQRRITGQLRFFQNSRFLKHCSSFWFLLRHRNLTDTTFKERVYETVVIGIPLCTFSEKAFAVIVVNVSWGLSSFERYDYADGYGCEKEENGEEFWRTETWTSHEREREFGFLWKKISKRKMKMGIRSLLGGNWVWNCLNK